MIVGTDEDVLLPSRLVNTVSGVPGISDFTIDREMSFLNTCVPIPSRRVYKSVKWRNLHSKHIGQLIVTSDERRFSVDRNLETGGFPTVLGTGVDGGLGVRGRLDILCPRLWVRPEVERGR